MSTLTPSEIASLWENAYGNSPTQLTINMTAIALAESAGKTDAVNGGSGATGLWQILISAHPQYTQEEMEDPQENAAAAVAIYKSQGYTAWTTYSGGAYKAYLTTAANAVANAQPYLQGTGEAQVTSNLPIVGGVENDVDDAVDATVSVGEFLGKVTEALFTEKGWIRILKFMAGVAFALFALKELFAGTGVGNVASNIVSKLPPLVPEI